MRAALAVAIACSTKRACNKAAPSAPSAGMSRVLAKPGSGALASTATATASVIPVSPCELFRICTEKICEPQPPHQDHCVEHAVLLPAPAGGGHALPQAQRFTDTLEPLRERDVFHQRDCRKPAYRPEGVATHEDCWSPVAMPVRRERRLMNQAIMGNNGERPSILTSKRPQARPDSSRPLSTRSAASAGSRVSA